MQASLFCINVIFSLHILLILAIFTIFARENRFSRVILMCEQIDLEQYGKNLGIAETLRDKAHADG